MSMPNLTKIPIISTFLIFITYLCLQPETGAANETQPANDYQ